METAAITDGEVLSAMQKAISPDGMKSPQSAPARVFCDAARHKEGSRGALVPPKHGSVGVLTSHTKSLLVLGLWPHLVAQGRWAWA